MPRVRILDQYCKGCGLCITVCPKQGLALADTVNRRGVCVAVVREDFNCSGCLNCVLICPDAAIEIIEEDEAESAK